MKLKIPNSFLLLFYIAILMALFTYIIPAGQYDRIIDPVSGISFVDPNSYKSIENTPVSILEFFESIPKGMIQSSDIIVFILITGGCFRVIQDSKFSNLFVNMFRSESKFNSIFVIIIFMIIFSFFGTLFGTVEEVLPLYPLMILFMQNMGYDRLTGVSVLLLGTSVGFVTGVLNPFTTGIAQEILELPTFSGISFRAFSFIFLLSVTIYFVCIHARKIYKKPEKNKKIDKNFKITLRDFLTLAVIVLGIIYLALHAKSNTFKITNISAVFLIMGIASGKINGMTSTNIVNSFIKGASSLISGALIIGLARAVTVIMESGNILDSIIYYLSSSIEGSNKYIDVTFMYFIQNLLNIFIPSGSGQAAITMPIMGPLADISGITRQSAVLAFQFGDGITNIISPTSTYFISALSISNIKWNEWVKFIWPLFISWIFIGWGLVIFSCFINYGPF